MDGVNEFVQPRIFYAYIISPYWPLWLIARVSHDMLCIHAVRKYENFPALVRNVGYIALGWEFHLRRVRTLARDTGNSDDPGVTAHRENLDR